MIWIPAFAGMTRWGISDVAVILVATIGLLYCAPAISFSADEPVASAEIPKSVSQQIQDINNEIRPGIQDDAIKDLQSKVKEILARQDLDDASKKTLGKLKVLLANLSKQKMAPVRDLLMERHQKNMSEATDENREKLRDDLNEVASKLASSNRPSPTVARQMLATKFDGAGEPPSSEPPPVSSGPNPPSGSSQPPSAGEKPKAKLKATIDPSDCKHVKLEVSSNDDLKEYTIYHFPDGEAKPVTGQDLSPTTALLQEIKNLNPSKKYKYSLAKKNNSAVVIDSTDASVPTACSGIGNFNPGGGGGGGGGGEGGKDKGGDVGEKSGGGGGGGGGGKGGGPGDAGAPPGGPGGAKPLGPVEPSGIASTAAPETPAAATPAAASGPSAGAGANPAAAPSANSQGPGIPRGSVSSPSAEGSPQAAASGASSPATVTPTTSGKASPGAGGEQASSGEVGRPLVPPSARPALPGSEDTSTSSPDRNSLAQVAGRPSAESARTRMAEQDNPVPTGMLVNRNETPQHSEPEGSGLGYLTQVGILISVFLAVPPIISKVFGKKMRDYFPWMDH